MYTMLHFVSVVDLFFTVLNFDFNFLNFCFAYIFSQHKSQLILLCMQTIIIISGNAAFNLIQTYL